MDKVREEFEDWFMKEKADKIQDDIQFLTKEIMYEGWKASRESIVVKIPKEGEASSFGNYIVFDYESVVKMLEEAGVRYE